MCWVWVHWVWGLGALCLGALCLGVLADWAWVCGGCVNWLWVSELRTRVCCVFTVANIRFPRVGKLERPVVVLLFTCQMDLTLGQADEAQFIRTIAQSLNTWIKSR